MPIATESPSAPRQHSQATFQTSPGHLRAAAHLYGVETAPLSHARVLELGCGAGGNLFPFALAQPHSVAVGVDVSPDAVAYGQAQAAALGVGNVHLFALSLDDLLAAESLGEFDYIVVHGIYASLDAATRQAVMQFCQAHLSALGVACFQYPTYPGQKVQDMLRDAVQLHASLADSEAERLQSAKAMLSFMANGLDANHPARLLLQKEAEKAAQKTDLEVSVEFLAPIGAPCYFVEFNDLAQQAGLAYVGDAEPYAELPDAFGDNVARLCQMIDPNGRKVLGQQYLDFAVNRGQRCSVLVRADRAGSVLASPDLDRLTELRWAGGFRRVLNADGEVRDVHLDAAGEPIGTTERTALAILDALGAAWPASLDFDALVVHASSIAEALSPDYDAKAVVQEALQKLFTKSKGMLRPSLELDPYLISASPQLRVVPWLLPLLNQTADAEQHIPLFNLWHTNVAFELSEPERLLLRCLDGQTAPEQWAGTLRRLALDADLSTADADGVSLVPLCALVDRLRRHGLIEASPAAWSAYYREAVQAHLEDPPKAVDYVDDLMIYSTPASKGGLASASAAGKRPAPVNAAFEADVKRVSALRESDKSDEAEALSRRMARQYPRVGRAWQVLNHTLLHASRSEEVMESALRCVALDPASADAYFQLAWSLRRLGWKWHAMYYVEKTVKLAPSNAPAWDHLGSAHESRRRYPLAERCHLKALELMPSNASILSNLATVYSYTSQMDKALPIYEKALKLRPEVAHIHSNYLFSLLHARDVSAQDVFERHREFGVRTERRVARTGGRVDLAGVDRSHDRPLRVGFVSGDLRSHAVAHFIEPYWKHLDRGAFSLYGYSTAPIEDVVTERFKRSAAGWRSVSDLSERELAETIRGDGIDILFDLSGHTAHNRLPTFAFKPAPVQISWIGYPGTSGLQAMDYRIVNKQYADAGVLDAQFTEKLLYMDTASLFEPDPSSPPVNALPASSRNIFTFASFNRAQKMSDDVLAAFGRILEREPASMLVMANMNGAGMIEDFRQRMLALGVDVDRVQFKDRMDMPAYMKLHLEVDLLLDTFPYTGGTTTNHALWMGVPTLTLAGQTLVSRQTMLLMRQHGLDEFITQSVDEYVERACAWRHRIDELAEIRAGLRHRVQTHSGENTDLVTAQALGRALRHVWQTWCRGEAPRSVMIE